RTCRFRFFFSSAVAPPPDLSSFPTRRSSDLTFDNGASGDSTVYVSSIDAFSDAVTLSSTVSPSGLSCTIVPDIVTPSVYYYTTSALSCSSSIAGIYSLNVTGSSGSLTHSVLLTVTVLLVNFDI